MVSNLTVNAIFATGRFGEFGNKGELPWGHCRQDMLHFSAITQGSIIVMGRKTFESLPFHLKGRMNVVLTTNPRIDCFAQNGDKPDITFDPSELLAYHTLTRWLRAMGEWYKRDVYVIGGAGLIDQVVKNGEVDYIFKTTFLNEEKYEADTYQHTLLGGYQTIGIPEVHDHKGTAFTISHLAAHRRV